MLKQRKQSFETVQPLFLAAERATDLAAADAATCIAAVLRERININVPVQTGSEMIERLVDAFNANVQARFRLLDAHALAPGVVRQLGLERMFGDGSPCPPTDREMGSDTVIPITAAG